MVVEMEGRKERKFQITAKEETKNIIKSAANGIQISINIYLSEHSWASPFFAFED